MCNMLIVCNIICLRSAVSDSNNFRRLCTLKTSLLYWYSAHFKYNVNFKRKMETIQFVSLVWFISLVSRISPGYCVRHDVSNFDKGHVEMLFVMTIENPENIPVWNVSKSNLCSTITTSDPPQTVPITHDYLSKLNIEVPISEGSYLAQAQVKQEVLSVTGQVYTIENMMVKCKCSRRDMFDPDQIVNLGGVDPFSYLRQVFDIYARTNNYGRDRQNNWISRKVCVSEGSSGEGFIYLSKGLAPDADSFIVYTEHPKDSRYYTPTAYLVIPATKP